MAFQFPIWTAAGVLQKGAALSYSIGQAIGRGIARRLHPQPRDVGMVHGDGKSGIHLREDGLLEIWAGGVAIQLDGKDGTISIHSGKLNMFNPEINMLMDRSKLYTQTGHLNPKYLPSDIAALASKKSGSLPIERDARSPFVPLNGSPAWKNCMVLTNAMPELVEVGDHGPHTHTLKVKPLPSIMKPQEIFVADMKKKDMDYLKKSMERFYKDKR